MIEHRELHLQKLGQVSVGSQSAQQWGVEFIRPADIGGCWQSVRI
jgi:hypothetical protein